MNCDLPMTQDLVAKIKTNLPDQLDCEIDDRSITTHFCMQPLIFH